MDDADVTPNDSFEHEMGMPAWATDPSSMLITEADYEALPSEICRSIEVVDGRVIFCESPTPAHQRVSRNLTMALLTARLPSPCIDVLQDTDMRFRHRNPHVTRAASSSRSVDPTSSCCAASTRRPALVR